MKQKQILLNALTTVAQLIGNAAILFFLYRFLIRRLGIEQLGVWSLLLATTSLVSLANQGLSMSIVRFVAKYAGRGSSDDVSRLVQTAIISAAVLVGLISLGLYPAARWALSAILPAARVSEALAILPLALLSLWFNVLGTITQAGLAGHEWITVCNYIEFAGALSYLGLAFLFVPGCGLVGLAAAQAAQAAFGLFAAWHFLRRRVPSLPWLPRQWNRVHFKEMAGYGAHFQWITVCQSLREPVTKTLLTKFAGLAYTGFYDMAARLVVTLRETIVQANQVLVPTVAALHERDAAAIPRIYRESYRLVFFLTVPSFALLVVASPLVSTIWIGSYQPLFVRFVAILAAGWLVNVLCNPAYIIDLGTGALRWVSTGVAATAVMNFGLGFAAGKFLGGTAIVACAAFSLIVGYLIVLVAYHRHSHQDFGVLLPHESRTVLVISILGAMAVLPILYSPGVGASMSAMLVATTFLGALMAIPMWSHPIRRRLFSWLASGAGIPT